VRVAADEEGSYVGLKVRCDSEFPSVESAITEAHQSIIGGDSESNEISIWTADEDFDFLDLHLLQPPVV
jgi:hypothetical protein